MLPTVIDGELAPAGALDPKVATTAPTAIAPASTLRMVRLVRPPLDPCDGVERLDIETSMVVSNSGVEPRAVIDRTGQAPRREGGPDDRRRSRARHLGHARRHGDDPAADEGARVTDDDGRRVRRGRTRTPRPSSAGDGQRSECPSGQRHGVGG